MNDKQRTYWRACYLAVVALSIITFTPLVIPAGIYRPMLAGMPYTLWLGILVTVLLVVLTFLATQLYHPPGNEEPAGLTSDFHPKTPE